MGAGGELVFQHKPPNQTEVHSACINVSSSYQPRNKVSPPLDCGTQAFNSQDTAPSMPSPSNKSQITSAWTQSKPVMKPGASFNQEKQLEEHLLEPHGIDMRRHAHSC